MMRRSSVTQVPQDMRWQAGRRRPLSARRHARRLHCAQRDDPGLPAPVRLGPHRAEYRRPVLVGGAGCRAISACSSAAVIGRCSGAWTISASTGPGMAGTAGCRPKRPCLAALRDRQLMETIVLSAETALEDSGRPFERLSWFLRSAGDPNDRDVMQDNADGVRYTPLTTRDHRRVGSRERLLEAAERHPDRLRIELDALATRVLLDEDDRAIGVEYLKGERLYRAHARPSEAPGSCVRRTRVREVILAGGAFNTPQLLMLSGIGPRSRAGAARDRGTGRPARRRPEPAGPLRGRRRQPDALRPLGGAGRGAFRARRSAVPGLGAGSRRLYATNGAGLAVITRSEPDLAVPDLFCMALLGRFSRLLSRLCAGFGPEPQLPELGGPEGAYRKSRWRGDAGFSRSARPAKGQFPLLRGGQRHRRR